MARECRSAPGKLVDRLVLLAWQAVRSEGQAASARQRAVSRPPGCPRQLRPGEVTVERSQTKARGLQKPGGILMKARVLGVLAMFVAVLAGSVSARSAEPHWPNALVIG